VRADVVRCVAAAKADADAAKQREKAAREAEAELEKMRRDLERAAATQRTTSARTTRPRSAQSPLDSIIKTAGNTLVREITRSILGTRRR